MRKQAFRSSFIEIKSLHQFAQRIIKNQNICNKNVLHISILTMHFKKIYNSLEIPLLNGHLSIAFTYLFCHFLTQVQ